MRCAVSGVHVVSISENSKVPAQRIREPVALGHCSGTDGFIVGVLGKPLRLPMSAFLSVRFACVSFL